MLYTTYDVYISLFLSSDDQTWFTRAILCIDVSAFVKQTFNTFITASFDSFDNCAVP